MDLLYGSLLAPVGLKCDAAGCGSLLIHVHRSQGATGGTIDQIHVAGCHHVLGTPDALQDPSRPIIHRSVHALLIVYSNPRPVPIEKLFAWRRLLVRRLLGRRLLVPTFLDLRHNFALGCHEALREMHGGLSSGCCQSIHKGRRE